MDVDEAKRLHLLHSECGGYYAILEVATDGTENKVAYIGSDGGEPEDQLLCRDYSWVVDALNDAYRKGREDAETAQAR